jgi:oxygen-independent coproporphyrinogen-3 oxidase
MVIPTKLTTIERSVYRKYARLALPRHTSYPCAPYWREDYREQAFRHDLLESAEEARPVSLYVHIPFCEKLCYYCACTKEIVPAHKRDANDPGKLLLEGLDLETARLGRLLEAREVHQVHLGGGSPTFLKADQLEKLGQLLADRFHIVPDAERAVEIDPRITSRVQLQTLRDLGFQRVSLGIQDFSPVVQKAVNRLQSLEMVRQVVAWCRELEFKSINFDLIYGLPFQTLDSMADTLDKTVGLAPDRIAFYRLAVIPEIFRWQNVFRPQDLPAGDLPLDLNLLAINRLQEAGYEFIGLDHFARPDEALARARREQSLCRNFQGMTTGKEMDLVGLGPSAISQLDRAFAQNEKASATWRAAVDRDLAIERGLRLSADDRLRRELLQQLYGYGIITKHTLENRFGIAFDDYFANECKRLQHLVDDGLVQVEPAAIRLTAPLGRLLVRVVAAVFDAYLDADAYRDGMPASLSSKVG